MTKKIDTPRVINLSYKFSKLKDLHPHKNHTTKKTAITIAGDISSIKASFDSYPGQPQHRRDSTNVNPLNFCFPAALKYAIVILNLAPPCAMDPLLIPTRLVMQQHVRFGRIATVLPVKDIQLAKAFYVDGLNFEVVFENGDPVGFVILKREAAELHLTFQPQHKAAAFPIAHLLVDDANVLYSRCQAQAPTSQP